MKNFLNSKTFKIFIFIWGAFLLFPSWGNPKNAPFGEFYVGKYFLFTPPAVVLDGKEWKLSSTDPRSGGRNNAVICLSIMLLQGVFLSGATLVSYLIEKKIQNEPKKVGDRNFYPL